ncbi:MAG: hypothetical protein Q4B91_07620 [Atopobiaceae bacterium]|nr:hypothetical protein [Atopobiaceae bacterium]
MQRNREDEPCGSAAKERPNGQGDALAIFISRLFSSIRACQVLEARERGRSVVGAELAIGALAVGPHR